MKFKRRPQHKQTATPVNAFPIPYSNYIGFTQANETHINTVFQVTYHSASTISTTPTFGTSSPVHLHLKLSFFSFLDQEEPGRNDFDHKIHLLSASKIDFNFISSWISFRSLSRWTRTSCTWFCWPN